MIGGKPLAVTSPALSIPALRCVRLLGFADELFEYTNSEPRLDACCHYCVVFSLEDTPGIRLWERVWDVRPCLHSEPLVEKFHIVRVPVCERVAVNRPALDEPQPTCCEVRLG